MGEKWNGVEMSMDLDMNLSGLWVELLDAGGEWL
jgi:hypothetical protein